MSIYCTAASSAFLLTLQDSAPSASPSAESKPDDRSTAFRPDEGGGNVASGEVLLIQAYAVIWLLAFGLVLSSVRKQRMLDARITRLQGDLDNSRKDG
jgi:hypothetical protein